MKYVIPFFLGLLMWSCSAKNEQTTPTKQPKVCRAVQANTTIELGVKGMVCQMGCGGSIRKALKETCAVARVEVNYQDSLEEQIVKVHYDRKQIAPEQMIQLLSSINDRQFTVRTLGAAQSIQ